jgi:hypothetical protein
MINLSCLDLFKFYVDFFAVINGAQSLKSEYSAVHLEVPTVKSYFHNQCHLFDIITQKILTHS